MYNPYMMYPQYPAQQQSQPQMQQPMQPQTNIIWVEGEADARAFQVAPNTTVPLWDRNAQVIYYKSSDANGMPSMRIIDYTIRDVMPQQNNQLHAQYITEDKFNAQINELKQELNKLKESQVSVNA